MADVINSEIMDDIPDNVHSHNIVRALFNNEHFPRSTLYNLDVDELDESSSHCPTPVGSLITLKPHQETLLHRCIQIENEKISLNTIPSLRGQVDDTQSVKLNMGVIADRVGSGKSFVVLALIKTNNITSNTTHVVKSYGLNGMIFESFDSSVSMKTNVLVIPHNLPAQWEKAVNDFGGGIRYIMLNKKKVFEHILNGDVKIEDYDLLIVTSTYYKQLASYIREKRLKVQRLIFDEIDNVVISGCTRINAMFYWFITASYGNVLYPRGFHTFDSGTRRYVYFAEGMRTPGFVKTVFTELADNLPKELMKLVVIKNKESYVQASLQLPPINNKIITCMTPTSIRILSGVVDNEIINALNANDVVGAMNLISSSHKTSERNIITLMIDKYKKEVNNLNARLRMIKELQYDHERDRQTDENELLKKIKDVQNKIKLIEERIHSNEFCSICYDDIDNKTVVECCQNSFCFKCISIWMSKKSLCPMCKTVIIQDNLFIVDNSEAGPSTSNAVAKPKKDLFNSDYTKQFDKNTNLKKILKMRKVDPKFKCLLFSCYDNSFHTIVPILESVGISYSYVKGRGDVIKNIVNRYKTGDLQVLLINVHDYGSGLNLENTSDIVMFHKFDSEIEKQVIGRAHRYGRSGELTVWYLLHGNEIAS